MLETQLIRMRWFKLIQIDLEIIWNQVLELPRWTLGVAQALAKVPSSQAMVATRSICARLRMSISALQIEDLTEVTRGHLSLEIQVCSLSARYIFFTSTSCYMAFSWPQRWPIQQHPGHLTLWCTIKKSWGENKTGIMLNKALNNVGLW